VGTGEVAVAWSGGKPSALELSVFFYLLGA
jgi:hypothetical protein